MFRFYIPANNGNPEMTVKSDEIYLRVPPNGKTFPLCGRGHSWFYTHILNGPGRKYIRLYHDVQKGNSKGTWMYYGSDLMKYLNILAEQQRDR